MPDNLRPSGAKPIGATLTPWVGRRSVKTAARNGRAIRYGDLIHGQRVERVMKRLPGAGSWRRSLLNHSRPVGVVETVAIRRILGGEAIAAPPDTEFYPVLVAPRIVIENPADGIESVRPRSHCLGIDGEFSSKGSSTACLPRDKTNAERHEFPQGRFQLLFGKIFRCCLETQRIKGQVESRRLARIYDCQWNVVDAVFPYRNHAGQLNGHIGTKFSPCCVASVFNLFTGGICT